MVGLFLDWSQVTAEELGEKKQLSDVVFVQIFGVLLKTVKVIYFVYFVGTNWVDFKYLLWVFFFFKKL